MVNIRHIKLFFGALGVVLFIGMCADNYRKTNSVSRFYEIIQPKVKDELTLSAVLFYDSSEGDQVKHADNKDKDVDVRKQAREFRSFIKKQIKKQLDDFRNASRALKEVDFLSVDLADKDISQLRATFDVRYSPEIRLFKRGNPLKIDNKIVAIKGDFAQEIILNESKILSFVHKHFDHDIQTLIKARIKAKHELDVAYASAPRATNFSLGFGYGPYGYGYPYGGWGWGGGWGGGWGCYRCGFGMCC